MKLSTSGETVSLGQGDSTYVTFHEQFDSGGSVSLHLGYATHIPTAWTFQVKPSGTSLGSYTYTDTGFMIGGMGN